MRNRAGVGMRRRAVEGRAVRGWKEAVRRVEERRADGRVNVGMTVERKRTYGGGGR